MAQLQFTLDSEFFTGLFKKDYREAFGLLMEQMLNQFLLAESAEVLKAEEYERSEEREDYRNGIRERSLTTRIGTLTLRVPRHRNEPFHTVLLESYQRSEVALITTMMEMVIQGVSTRKVEKVTQELCGASFSKSTVSELCKSLDKMVLEFKNQRLKGSYPFVMFDALYIKIREDFKVKKKALLLAIGFNKEGLKEILGFDVQEKESEESWSSFLKDLKRRGLSSADFITSDSHTGLVKAIREVYPDAIWQRCQAHLKRNIIDATPKKYWDALSKDLTEMFDAPTFERAKEIRNRIYDEYEQKAPAAMKILDEGFLDSMSVMALPRKYRKSIRTSNFIERENAELRRREKAIRVFPNTASAIRLLGAVLIDHNADWACRCKKVGLEEYWKKREGVLAKIREIA